MFVFYYIKNYKDKIFSWYQVLLIRFNCKLIILILDKYRNGNNKIIESLYATQAKIDKLSNNPSSNLGSTSNPKPPQKSEAYLKYKKQSKEDLKNLSGLIKPTKGTAHYPSHAGIGITKSSNPNCLFDDARTLSKEDNFKQHKRKKMSEETYPESKGSISNLIKKQKKNLASKKGRKDVKQYIGDGNMFKQSKEKKLDFSIGDSPTLHNKNFNYVKDRLRGSIQRIRRELIQDDSEDEMIRETEQIESQEDQNNKQTKANALRESVCYESNESNPLQRIIEQRKMESSTDPEESEDELDDDYDIGIDDIELPTEGNQDDLEKGISDDEDFNILLNSYDSNKLEEEKVDFHKNKLKETLGKNKEEAPFTDVIEKGIKSHLNNQIKASQKSMSQKQNKEIKKASDYNERKDIRGGARPTSQLQKR